jgi:type VI secretion system protein ImpE
MEAKELIAAGKLTEARAQLTDQVKKAPSDSRARTLLFQVLAFLGELDKAERHLDMIATLSPRSETGVQVYRDVVHAERQRRGVVNGTSLPGFVSGIPPYLDRFLTGWKKVRENALEEAHELFEQVEAERRTPRGVINGATFEDFCDTDGFLSYVLEVIVHDRYIWVPFESIAELSVDQPRTLFDLLWIPAHLVTWEHLDLMCYLPVLYPESFIEEDERIRLGRTTEWRKVGDSLLKGVGQHVYQAGDEDIALLEIREMTFTPPGKDRQDEEED